MAIPLSYSYRNLLARRLTSFLTAAVGVLAALLPAWRATRVRIAEALRKVG